MRPETILKAEIAMSRHLYLWLCVELKAKGWRIDFTRLINKHHSIIYNSLESCQNFIDTDPIFEAQVRFIKTYIFSLFCKDYAVETVKPKPCVTNFITK